VHISARLLLALLLVMSSTSVAIAQSDDQPTDQPAADTGTGGPTLTPDNASPTACDESRPALRYVQVRGAAFYGWASQRLPGVLLDGNGDTQASWKTIWVNPAGNLTVLVNLCSDDFLQRPPLAVGDYLLSVNDPTTDSPIAQTMISVQPAPEPSPVPTINTTPGPVTPIPTPQPTQPPAFPPQSSATANGTPTAAPAGSAATTTTTSSAFTSPTPVPRTGLGSQQHPIPLGSSGDLGDGWQIAITGVTPDAWSAIQSNSPGANGPPTNMQDFMVRLQATFSGSQSTTPAFSPYRLRLVGSSGSTYDSLDNSCGLTPDDISLNQFANGVVRGNVCFTVRSSDVSSLLLYDSQQTSPLYFATH
jgi:hypothetical protein